MLIQSREGSPRGIFLLNVIFSTMTSYTLSIRDQTCPNKRCSFYRKRLEGNIVVHGRTYPRFRCKGCKKTWNVHRNELRYCLKKDFEKIESALVLLQQGFSVRKTAQEIGVSPGTVQRWKFKFREKITK